MELKIIKSQKYYNNIKIRYPIKRSWIFIKELNEDHNVLDDQDYLMYFLEENSIFIVKSEFKIISYPIAQVRD